MGTFEYRHLKSLPQKTTMTNIHRKVINFLVDRTRIEVERSFPPYSVDIFLPDLNVAVECDGGKWHNYPYGSEKDRYRDAVLVEKYGILRVVRIWGCDIANSAKLRLILDGILHKDLLNTVRLGYKVVVDMNGKKISGIVKKQNKLSYSTFFPSLKKDVAMDRYGLISISGNWFRCLALTKEKSIDIYGEYLLEIFKKAAMTKQIYELRPYVVSIKKAMLYAE